jgi:hypothetical protein
VRVRTKLALAAVVVLIGALAVLVSGRSVPGLIDVVDKGTHVLPVDYPGAEIRVLGTFTLLIDLDRGDSFDALTGIALTAVSTAALLASLALSRIGGSERLARFYLIAGGATGWLALDELLALHETIGHNLRPLLPGVDKPDDLILAIYLVLAVAILFVFRRELLRDKVSRALMAAAAAGFGTAMALDILAITGEEPLEVVAAGCAGASFLRLLARDLLAVWERRGAVATASGAR